MAVHIITVGISLISNYVKEVEGSKVPEAELAGRVSSLHPAERKDYSKKLVEYIKRKEREGKLMEASAELNAFSRYLREASLAYLICSDTPVAELCALALKSYIEEKGVQVAEIVRVKGLSGRETFQQGLAELVEKIADIVSHHKDCKICATGGFKPEVALASVVGFIAQVPVYYIHESFREEVHLPAVPITWSIQHTNRKLIQAVIDSGEEGISKVELESRFGRDACQALVRSWLIEEKDEKYVTTKVARQLLMALIKPLRR